MGLGKAGELISQLWSTVYPALSRLSGIHTFPPHGIRLQPVVQPSPFSSLVEWETEPGTALELITVDWTFGTEVLSAASPWLQQVEDRPCLLIHPGDARDLGFEGGETVVLRTPGEGLALELCVKAKMAQGVLVLPRHHLACWQHLGARAMGLDRKQLQKKDEEQP
jgi:anaerobic selenocysteine-containing dehydrogenase